MSTALEHLPTSDKSDQTSGSSAFQSLADLDLHQFRTAIDSHTSKLSLPDLFPTIGFERKISRDDTRPHTGTTDASKEAAKKLYGDFTNPLDAIKPDACIQPAGIGNCYFVAALASLAKTNPQKIKDMIQVNDDGTYTVKFPGASKSVTVDKPTPDEIAQDGGATKFGSWSLIVQKAYGKYCGGGKHDLDGSDGGSAFSAGVRILSEHGVVNEGIGYMLPLMSWKSLDQELKDTISPKNPKDALPVTVSTAKSLFTSNTADGFVRGHVYSILDYKSNPNDIKQSKVTVRNPWGGADAVKEITLDQFCANFFQLSVPRR